MKVQPSIKLTTGTQKFGWGPECSTFLETLMSLHIFHYQKKEFNYLPYYGLDPEIRCTVTVPFSD